MQSRRVVGCVRRLVFALYTGLCARKRHRCQDTLLTMRIVVLACLIAGSLIANGQARNNNWLFGTHTWLTFNNGTATVQPLAYHPSFRAASMSDTLGNFLMLVDDSGVRDAMFGLMPGGAAADLGYAGEQGNYLILPKPGNPQAYVVLVNSREDLHRAGAVEVDMSLNGGLGAVSTPMYWYMDSATAKLAATPHGNGSEYWILQHEDGTDEFHAFHWGAGGVAPVPVISHAGSTLLPTTAPAPTADFWGSMKFNVQGDMIAMVNQDPLADTTTIIQLFQFDDLTGSVTFLASIDHHYTDWIDSVEVVYDSYHRQFGGIEFDATGHHLYSYSWDTVPPVEWNQYAFQTYLGDLDPDSLQASTIILYSVGWSAVGIDPRGSMLQLGPDGRIFFRVDQAPWNLNWGWLINIPGTLGSMQLQADFFPATPDTVSGLPNFCKRYHDSEPAWLGVADTNSEGNVFVVWPNPMTSHAWFQVNGADEPDHVTWLDAVGRVVRTEAVRVDGGAVLLERGDLPSGMYVVESRHGGRPLGRGRVTVE